MSASAGNTPEHSEHRPATLAEALAILKAIHKLSPAEQRDIDEAISCIVAFDGITDEMVERALDAAHEHLKPKYIIDLRPPPHPQDLEGMRAALEAVIDGMKPMRSKSGMQSESTESIEAMRAALAEERAETARLRHKVLTMPAGLDDDDEGFAQSAELGTSDDVLVPRLSTVEIQQTICAHVFGSEYEDANEREKSSMRSCAVDIYNAIITHGKGSPSATSSTKGKT